MKYSVLIILIMLSHFYKGQISTANKFKPNLVLITVAANDLYGQVKGFTKSDIFIQRSGNSYTETKNTVNKIPEYGINSELQQQSRIKNHQEVVKLLKSLDDFL